MSDNNYKYTSLIETLRTHETFGLLIRKYEKECDSEISILFKFLETETKNNVLDLILTHNELQVRLALKYDYFEERYARLSKAVNFVSLQRENENLLVVALLELGQAIEAMDRLTEIDLMKLRISELGLKQAEELRQLPLKKKSSDTEIAKKIVQGFALDEWKKDIEQKIRTTDMCHIIHNKVQKMCDKLGLLKYLPSDDERGIRKPNPEKLKPWLKEVAPAYAKKAGRPPKI